MRSVVLSLSGIIAVFHFLFVFFFDDRATLEIYTLSLHDALPIYQRRASKIRLNGVSAARRKCVKPALRNTSASRASPACAPSTRWPPSEIACAQQIVVDAA